MTEISKTNQKISASILEGNFSDQFSQVMNDFGSLKLTTAQEKQ